MGEKAAEDAPHHRWNENQTAGRDFLQSAAFLDNLLRPGPVTKLLQLSLSSPLFFFFLFLSFPLDSLWLDISFLSFLFFCVYYLLVFQACTHLTNPFSNFYFSFFYPLFQILPSRARSELCAYGLLLLLMMGVGCYIQCYYWRPECIAALSSSSVGPSAAISALSSKVKSEKKSPCSEKAH